MLLNNCIDANGAFALGYRKFIVIPSQNNHKKKRAGCTFYRQALQAKLNETLTRTFAERGILYIFRKTLIRQFLTPRQQRIPLQLVYVQELSLP